MAPEFHYFSSQSRKSNAKFSILFFPLPLFFFPPSFPSCITEKVYDTYEHSTDQTNPLLSEIFLFLVRTACELRSTNSGPKHASRWLFYMPFLCNYTHNSKTKGGIRTFYLLNDCFTIEHIYSLGYSCMRDTVSKLWIQTHMANTFTYGVLHVLTLVTRKLRAVRRHSTYRMTALVSEMSIFCVRAG